jgi:hypothetical protein
VPKPGSTLPTLANLAELCRLGRNREIADDMKHVAATDRIAIDGRDDRLGNVANDAVQILDVEAEVGAYRIAFVAAFFARRLIAAGAEGAVAGAGENYRADGAISPGQLESFDQLIDGL